MPWPVPERKFSALSPESQRKLLARFLGELCKHLTGLLMTRTQAACKLTARLARRRLRGDVNERDIEKANLEIKACQTEFKKQRVRNADVKVGLIALEAMSAGVRSIGNRDSRETRYAACAAACDALSLLKANESLDRLRECFEKVMNAEEKKVDGRQ
jgi:hypothetical protein